MCKAVLPRPSLSYKRIAMLTFQSFCGIYGVINLMVTAADGS